MLGHVENSVPYVARVVGCPSIHGIRYSMAYSTFGDNYANIIVEVQTKRRQWKTVASNHHQHKDCGAGLASYCTNECNKKYIVCRETIPQMVVRKYSVSNPGMVNFWTVTNLPRSHNSRNVGIFQ